MMIRYYRFAGLEFQIELSEVFAYTEERQVDPEDPSPTDVLCEAATCSDQHVFLASAW